MSDQDELRARMDRVIDKALDEWNTSGAGGISDSNYVAQAIIDEFGLTVETGHITGQGYGLPGVIGKRVVGKWEKQ